MLKLTDPKLKAAGIEYYVIHDKGKKWIVEAKLVDRVETMSFEPDFKAEPLTWNSPPFVVGRWLAELVGREKAKLNA